MIFHLFAVLSLSSIAFNTDTTTNNTSFQNYPHPDDHTIQTTEK